MPTSTEDDDGRGRNATAVVFALVAVLVIGWVARGWFVKQGRIAALKSADPARQARAMRELIAASPADSQIAEQFQGERPSVRMAAVRALRVLGADPAVPEVLRKDAARRAVPFLKDTDQPVRDLAIQTLAAIGPRAALPAATAALGDPDATVKLNAQYTCQSLAPHSIAAILAYSGHLGATARLRTVHRTTAGNAFHEISKRKITPWITLMLFGEDAVEASRRGLSPYQAARELERFLELPQEDLPDQERIFGLVHYLNPRLATEEDQNNVISILDRLADKRAVPFLIPKLESLATRRAAVGTLGRLADRQATPHLIRLLETDETNRLEIVVALGRIADPAAVPSLIGYGLDSVSQPVRMAAADSLRNIGAPAVPALYDLLMDRDEERSGHIAEGAVRALAGIRDERARDAAIGALGDAEVEVRRAASAALGDANHPATIAPLIRAFGDADGTVASRAARSVSALGGAAVPTLTAALSDESRVYWASQSLRYIGAPAVPALRATVVSGTPGAARAAAALLGELGDPAALPSLKQAVAARRDADFTFIATGSIQRLGGR